MERSQPSHGADCARASRRTAALAGLLATAALVSAACSGNHRPATPAPSGTAFAHGTASWYGPKFNGRRTASGERYDMHGLTAAHPTLPFGTLVRVTNVENGRQVVVRINDRGPFGRRRIIDLSYAAAGTLAMVGPGTAEVELALIGRNEPAAAPAPPPTAFVLASAAPGMPTPPISPGASGGSPAQDALEPAAAPSEPAASVSYTVQIGAFDEVERANTMQHDLARLYPDAAVYSDGIWNRVQIGRFGDREQAEQMRRDLVALGLAAVVVTAH